MKVATKTRMRMNLTSTVSMLNTYTRAAPAVPVETVDAIVAGVVLVADLVAVVVVAAAEVVDAVLVAVPVAVGKTDSK